MNMSRASKFISLAAAALAVVACGGSKDNADNKASVEGVLAAAPSSEVIFGRLDANQMLILDTLKTAADSTYKYELDILPGDPEFVYVINEGRSVAYLLLKSGDAVTVNIDAAGNAAIEGSQESAKLTNLQNEHIAMSSLFEELSAELENASSSRAKAITRRLTEEYYNYNKSSRKYVMENPHSLTSIAVLYRQLGSLPVFNMTTDALLFNSIADSLQKTYPRSKYVRTFRAVADQRSAEFELANRLEAAEQIGYFDIELPGLDGKNKKLSDINSKVVLLYFWSAASAGQNNFNVDVLKKIYNKYHSKGFDIYQVSLDVDKVMWATTVMGQDLPWTNVNDMNGIASQYVQTYNLQAIPSAFIIHNGELIDGDIVDEASFRKLLDKLLK